MKVSTKDPWIIQSQKLIGVKGLIESYKAKHGGELPESMIDIMSSALNKHDLDNCFFNDPKDTINYLWIYMPQKNDRHGKRVIIMAPRAGGPFQRQDTHRLVLLSNGVIDWIEEN